MGMNLAPYASITCSSCIDPYSPYRTVDGNVSDCTSRWLCGALPGWIIYDLKAPYWIGQWSLRSIGGCAGWPVNYCMTSFTLQYSQTGSSWTNVDSVSNNNSLSYTKTITPVNARFWRVYVPSKGGLQANLDAASIMEVQLNQADPTPNTLTSLVLKDANGAAVALDPAFASATINYTATVPFSNATVTVTPTATDSGAVITVNNMVVASGNTSQPINLTVGAATPIIVVVTPRVGDPKAYTINVVRPDSTRLTSLTVKDNNNAAISLDPNFAPDTTSYSANIGFDSTAITVTLTPTREGVNATITVDGTTVASGTASQPINVPAVGGSVSVPVVVSSTGAVSTTYSVNLVKSSSPYLKSVMMSGMRLPAFVKTQYVYNNINTTAANTSVTATSEDAAASVVISLNGTNYASGQSVPLSLGNNAINIKVTSAIGGDTRTYVYNVNKTA